jgi:hypothetical protein
MDTAAITISGLADLMLRMSARAYNPELRSPTETDAVLLGELNMLDLICDPIWVSGREMTPAEEQKLSAAREELGSAWDYLSVKQAEAA